LGAKLSNQAILGNTIMAQIANLVLADGQSTPANHTFEPMTPQQGTSVPAQWLNKEAISNIGYRRVTLSVKYNPNGVSKVKAVISDPVLASVAAGCCVDVNTPQVAYTDIASIEFSIPAAATLQNKKDILAYAKNLLSNQVMTDAIVNMQPAW
jgi:hypothetical protein